MGRARTWDLGAGKENNKENIGNGERAVIDPPGERAAAESPKTSAAP